MYLKKFQLEQIIKGYMKMNINNFEELFKYLDGLSTYKRATIDFQSFSEKARKEWNIQN